MVDDKLCGVGAEDLINGHGVQRLRDAAEVCPVSYLFCNWQRRRLLTSNLPLWPILAPQSHPVFTRLVGMFPMEFNNTHAEVRPSSLHGLIVHPLVRAIGLGLGIVRPPAETTIFGDEAC